MNITSNINITKQNYSPSQIPVPSVMYNNSNLTKLYFSPNITAKPSYKISPSKTATVSFVPSPSIIATPIYIEKKNNSTLPSNKTNSLPINKTNTLRNLKVIEPNHNNCYLLIFVGILFIVMYCLFRCNKFFKTNKQKVDIKVPIQVPEEVQMEGAGVRMTPPRSGGKSPRFMVVQKDCDV
jgi:hypothetical protein